MSFPTLDEIAIQAEAGSAISVIIEGESEGGDAFIYGDIWFPHRSREIRFFPQDGWTSVRDAVAQLRERLPSHRIYGIIDRDFTPDDEIDVLVSSGVYRSNLYSVENYLLDPVCWHTVFALIARNRGRLRAGWQAIDDVRAQILLSYRSAYPATAFNRAIAIAVRANPTCENSPPYIDYPADKRLHNPTQPLSKWSANGQLMTDPCGDYEAFLIELEGVGNEQIRRLVNGKLVLHTLVANFHASFPGGQMPRSLKIVDYVNLYLDKCPEPPEDAINLIQRILEVG